MKPGKAAYALKSCDSPAPGRVPELEAMAHAKARLRRFAEADSRFVELWDDLAREASEPNPFLESWYLLPGYELFGVTDDCRLLTVEDADGTLLGLLPLTIRDAYGRIPLRHVTNWSHGNAFLGTPLARKGLEAKFWREVLPCLDHSDWAASFLHIAGLTEGGPVHRALEQAAQELGRPCEVVLREDRPFVETDLGAEDYLRRNLTSKRRGEYRRKRRRLEENGALIVSELTDPSELERWCREFLELEAKGWKGKARSALASQAETRELFETALRSACERGQLYFVRMDLDAKPVAMQTSLISRPGAFGFKACFDEAYARFSVGMLLQLEALALIDRPGIAWQDSCSAGDHPVGSLWSERRSIARVTIPLAGFKRKLTHFVARTAERSARVARSMTGSSEDDQ